MFVHFGSATLTKSKHLGVVADYCPLCAKPDRFNVKEHHDQEKAHILVFQFVLKEKGIWHTSECCSCGAIYKVSIEKYERILSKEDSRISLPELALRTNLRLCQRLQERAWIRNSAAGDQSLDEAGLPAVFERWLDECDDAAADKLRGELSGWASLSRPERLGIARQLDQEINAYEKSNQIRCLTEAALGRAPFHSTIILNTAGSGIVLASSAWYLLDRPNFLVVLACTVPCVVVAWWLACGVVCRLWYSRHVIAPAEKSGIDLVEVLKRLRRIRDMKLAQSKDEKAVFTQLPVLKHLHILEAWLLKHDRLLAELSV